LELVLRGGRAQWVPRGATRPEQVRITGLVNISERPVGAEGRAVLGHGEGDLVLGENGRSRVTVLVERRTRFVVLARVPYGRTVERVVLILSQKIRGLPEELRESLTWDQGVEMAAHARFTIATDVPVFFCDSSPPRQRGSNEITDGFPGAVPTRRNRPVGGPRTELDEIAARPTRRPPQTPGSTPADAGTSPHKGH
jgi:transposase, IS30 family